MIINTNMSTISGVIAQYQAIVADVNKGTDIVGQGGNVFVGGAGDDSVQNYANGTVILTGAGDDTVISKGGKVTIDTGDGDDAVLAVGVGTSIDVGAGNDKIFGQGHSLTIDKGTGADAIYLSGHNIKISSDVLDDLGDKICSAAFVFEYDSEEGLAIKDISNVEDWSSSSYGSTSISTYNFEVDGQKVTLVGDTTKDWNVLKEVYNCTTDEELTLLLQNKFNTKETTKEKLCSVIYDEFK